MMKLRNDALDRARRSKNEVSILSKIIERVVFTQLTDYIEKERILLDVQSGFRAGYSAAIAMAHVTLHSQTYHIISNSEKGKGLGYLFC
ncbi:unnamed protein product [Leptosia nina]|uniref:Reverse transcriptase domain-containing protein n=1 Tax=Leptosia nina TaxID=320188 RepID=A0AAV1JQ69_9NEOP